MRALCLGLILFATTSIAGSSVTYPQEYCMTITSHDYVSPETWIIDKILETAECSVLELEGGLTYWKCQLQQAEKELVAQIPLNIQDQTNTGARAFYLSQYDNFQPIMFKALGISEKVSCKTSLWYTTGSGTPEISDVSRKIQCSTTGNHIYFLEFGIQAGFCQPKTPHTSDEIQE